MYAQTSPFHYPGYMTSVRSLPLQQSSALRATGIPTMPTISTLDTLPLVSEKLLSAPIATRASPADSNDEGQTSFLCPICAKDFARKQDMRRHLSCHSDIKPFTCQWCGRGFRRKDALKAHCSRKHSVALKQNQLPVAAVDCSSQSTQPSSPEPTNSASPDLSHSPKRKLVRRDSGSPKSGSPKSGSPKSVSDHDSGVVQKRRKLNSHALDTLASVSLCMTDSITPTRSPKSAEASHVASS